MAALSRPTEATYVLHENVTVDTTDNEDHTFCGVIFPIECKAGLPLDHMAITSISVRGMLGPISVWISKDPGEGSGAASAAKRTRTQLPAISVNPKHWTKIYQRSHPPSMRKFQELKLENPILLKPDEIRGIYIHSALPGDEAIVYDNRKGEFTHDDKFLRIRPGLAHLSNVPFGRTPPWGYGSPYRENREFVGRLSYGVVYKLWNPNEFFSFGSNFQTTTRTLFACQRRFESPMARLPDDVIFYILNMCRWDWFDDSAEKMIRAKNSKGSNGDEASGEESDGEEGDDDVAHAARRATRLRRSWARRSRPSLSILAQFGRGVLLSTLGASTDIEFVGFGDEDDGNAFELEDEDDEEYHDESNDDDDDEEWH